MQSNSQKIIKNTWVLYIRQLFTLALGLYTTRLTLQLLGVTDYGIYAAVGGVTWLLNIVSSVFTLGSQRFLTVEFAKQDFRQMNHVYIACVNLQIIVSCVLILIGETIGLWFLKTQMTIPDERGNVAFWVYQISLIGNVFYMLNVPNEAVIATRENFGFIALMSVVVSIFKFLSVIVLCYISWDKLILYALSLFLIQFLNRFFHLRYCKKHYSETHYRLYWNLPLMKSMLRISFWFGVYGLSTTSFLHGVVVLLNIFFGPVVNAAYAVAVQIYTGFRMFCSHFQYATSTQIIKLYTNGELDRMSKLLSSVCKISFFLFFIMSLPFLFNADFVLHLWLGEVPKHSVSFFILLSVFAYTDVFIIPLDKACLATGNVKQYFVVGSICLLLILPIAYIAFILGAIPESILIIAIIMSWIGLFSRVRMLSKLISLNLRTFYKHVILKVLLVFIISLIFPIIYHYSVNTNVYTIIFSFILTYLITSFVVYYIGFDPSEKMLIKDMTIRAKAKCFNILICSN